MTSCHLVADRKLTLLGNVYADSLVYAVLKVAVGLLCGYNDINYYAAAAVRNALGSILNLTCLLTEDSLVESFLCGLVCLTLR